MCSCCADKKNISQTLSPLTVNAAEVEREFVPVSTQVNIGVFFCVTFFWNCFVFIDILIKNFLFFFLHTDREVAVTSKNVFAYLMTPSQTFYTSSDDCKINKYASFRF